eukprot:COSAG02_NODE_176_length_31159_cov_30.469833_23_plen_91_part_00
MLEQCAAGAEGASGRLTAGAAPAAAAAAAAAAPSASAGALLVVDCYWTAARRAGWAGVEGLGGSAQREQRLRLATSSAPCGCVVQGSVQC